MNDCPHQYQANGSFVWSDDYTRDVLKLLAPKPTDKILDLGCGTGELTARLAGTCGSVVGVDVSEKMIKAAERTKPGELAKRLQYRVKDFHDLRDLEERGFDAVFSNWALHWAKDPLSVLRGVHAVLKPGGGRFVAEFAGSMTCAGLRATLRQALQRRGLDPAKIDPWYFPTPSAYQTQLEAAGFEVQSVELIARPTPLASGLEGWLKTFATAFLDAVDDPQDLIDEITDTLAVDLCDQHGNWTMLYMVLRISAIKR